MAFAMKRKRAFTLVEMLIVIVVVGILAGIYLLSAAPAIERAKETDCIADRATMKREYYLLKAENTFATSADLMKAFTEAVKNDLGRSNVSGDGHTFENICRDKGVYTCSLDENGAISIFCSSHDELSASAASLVITNLTAAQRNILFSEIAKAVRENNLGSGQYASSNPDLVTDVNKAISKLNPNGYTWLISKNSSSTFIFIVATDTPVNGSVSAVRYQINDLSGKLTISNGQQNGTVTINGGNIEPGTFKKTD